MGMGADNGAAGLAFLGKAAFLLSLALRFADGFHLRPEAVKRGRDLFLADGELLADCIAGVLQALVELEVLYLPMRYARISNLESGVGEQPGAGV
jgi:hypothetical protein